MTSSNTNEICGIVLAGGRSSRLGRDKARVMIDGRTLLERTLDLVKEFCPTTFCVGRDIRAQGIKDSWMMDDIPGMGPMGGIITALKNLDRPCLVLACDLPRMKPHIIRELIRCRNTFGFTQHMTTYYRRQTGFIEALVSVYEPRSLDLLEDAAGRNCYQLSRAVPYKYRYHIEYGPDQEEYFFNVNYPHDLDKLGA